MKKKRHGTAEITFVTKRKKRKKYERARVLVLKEKRKKKKSNYKELGFCFGYKRKKREKL